LIQEVKLISDQRSLGYNPHTSQHMREMSMI